ncbi:MAG: exosortase/archaeosortase family protein [Lentisphaerae bacterium]|nr:exosortase/archaeosortase family protein [Lentisphaerota bacterium]
MSATPERVEPESGGAVLAWRPFVVLTVLSVVALYGVQGNTEQVPVFGRSALVWMAERWNGSGGDLSHGWCIPVISAYALWRRREAVAAAPKRTCAWGLVLVVLAMLLHLVGVRAQQTRLALFSCIMLLAGLPLTFYGPAVGRLLIFPCAYLILCIPFSFLDSITVPLRMVATTASTILLNGLGIAARQSGTAIYSAAAGGFNFDVADACSGLRSLLAMTALTAAYAHFTQRGWWRQWTLFLSAIPLAIIGNVARIVTIAIVAQTFGRERAMVLYHDYSGYFVFAIAISLMLSIGQLLERIGRKRAP